MLDTTVIKKLNEEIKKANKSIIILSHRNPDGDSIGSLLALKNCITRNFSKKVICVCKDPIPQKFSFLPGGNTIVQDFNFNETSLFFTVDCRAQDLTNFTQTKPEIFSKNIPLINIDHHHDNDNFGTLNLVDENIASTTTIIYKIFDFLNLPIDPDTATCLLTGIYADTGSFLHKTTNAKLYRIAAKLIKKGGNFNAICKKLFFNMPINRLKLWGLILNRAIITDKNVLVSAVKEEDFISTNTSYEDVSGAIAYLAKAAEAKYCILLNENNEIVRGSLRTKFEDIDVSEIAHKFGGGGHKQAAGFSIPGKLKQDVSWKIVDREKETAIIQESYTSS